MWFELYKQTVAVIVQRKVNCSEITSILEGQLNYPSFSIQVISNSGAQVYSRTVTNLGQANSTYRVDMIPREALM